MSNRRRSHREDCQSDVLSSVFPSSASASDGCLSSGSCYLLGPAYHRWAQTLVVDVWRCLDCKALITKQLYEQSLCQTDDSVNVASLWRSEQ